MYGAGARSSAEAVSSYPKIDIVRLGWFPWLELVWADSGHNAWQVEAAVAKVPLLRREIVKRSDDMKDFVILPRRGGRADRLLVRTKPGSGQGLREPCRNLATFVTLASIQLALRRLAGA